MDFTSCFQPVNLHPNKRMPIRSIVFPGPRGRPARWTSNNYIQPYYVDDAADRVYTDIASS